MDSYDVEKEIAENYKSFVSAVAYIDDLYEVHVIDRKEYSRLYQFICETL